MFTNRPTSQQIFTCNFRQISLPADFREHFIQQMNKLSERLIHFVNFRALQIFYDILFCGLDCTIGRVSGNSSILRLLVEVAL